MKIYNYIKGIAIFLLFLIPLIYLYNYCDRLEVRSNKISEELIKEQLITEMDNFQDDLKPENYVKSAFQDLEKSFKFPDLNNSQYEYTYDEENKPDFIDNNFIAKSKAFLKDKYGFEPFIFVSSGFDFTNLNIDDKDSVFKNDLIKTEFLQETVNNIIRKDKNQINACLNSNKNYFKDEKEILLKGWNNDNIKQDLLKVKFISIFSKRLEQPEKCIYFFSNNFGNQNIYQYYNLFFKNKVENKKSIYNFLGLYYVLIKSTDFDIEKLLTKACKTSFNSSSFIKRNIIEKVVDLPSLKYSEDKITYSVPFPFYFYIFIEKQKTKDEKLYNKYIDYLENHSLEISVDKAYQKNNYSEYKYYIKILIVVIIFLLVFYFICLFLNLIKFDMSLSFKIRLIVLISIIIPMSGLWLIVSLTIKNEEKSYLSDVEKIIVERLRFFDKIKDDVENSLTFDLLECKKIIEDEYFKKTPDYFFAKFSDYYALNSSEKISELERNEAKKTINNLFSPNNSSYYITNIFNILDKKGKNLFFRKKNELAKKGNFRDIFFLFMYLNDLNILDLNSEENKNNEKQLIAYNSIVENYINLYSSRNILAKESLLIPSEKVTLDNKIVYQLIASQNNPKLPQAAIYNSINMKFIMPNRLTKLITTNNKYRKLLEQNFESVQIKYAIFDRNNEELSEKIPQPKVSPFYQIQKETAKLAMKKGVSGLEFIEKDDNYYLKAWQYYKDNPIVFTAVAMIPKHKISLVSIKIVSLCLIIYAVIAVILLSDFFFGALLEPIKTLLLFFKEISSGHINANINMKTGDELEELSYSLNNMSIGLCEREKLKRFVSDKLLSSLKNSNGTKITKANVTVLSSDIRSFTTISEKNSPEDVVCLLNDYFTLMEKTIVKYGGSIEKIVGDAISAAFYEDKSKDYSLNACKAALEMRENLKKFNKERSSKGLFTIENGIGLASGEVMIGFAGKKARRREFLLIGNILKEAEQLEAMTKIAVSSKIFIDKQTFEAVKDEMSFCEVKENTELFYKEIKL